MASPHTGISSVLYLPYRPNTGFKQPAPRKSKKREQEEAKMPCRPPPRSKLRETVTDSTWSRMEPKIRKLYHADGYQLRVVQEIMWCIYQFGVREGAYKRRFPKWGIQKNGTGAKSGNRSRSRAKQKPPPQRISGVILTPYEFDLHMHMNLEVPASLQPGQFKHHEKALQSVDSFIHGVFDRGSKGWSADIAGFLAPDGTRSPTTYYWRSLSDRCHGVALLIRAGLHSKAETTLEQIFQDLQAVSCYRDPAFIVVFWRLCLRLQGVDCHIPHAKVIERLFAVVKESQADNNPISLLITSLRQIDPKDLRNVLRIGYLKAIKTLTELIGDENVMVLDMVSFYCKFFTTQYLVRQALIAKFEYVWHQTYNLHTDDSTAGVAISYAFASAAYYVFDAPYLAIGMAEKLRNTVANHPCLAEPAQWTLEAEAFSFASKTVAELYRQRVNQAKNLESASDEYAKCCASMQGAVTKLEKGDRECRTRAAMLSRVLNRWFVEWDLHQQAHEEGLRTRRIEDSIPGKTCRRCLRSRYCRDCAHAVENGLSPRGNEVDGPSKGPCRFCKPFKISRLCQKCGIRQKAVGWKPPEKWFKAHKGTGAAPAGDDG